MKLIFRKNKLPINELRKLKLNHINGNKDAFGISFNWNLSLEDEEERKDRLENFHLFCLSIVEDLFNDNFKTNENGVIRYEKHTKDENDKIVVEKIKNMMNVILSNKNEIKNEH